MKHLRFLTLALLASLSFGCTSTPTKKPAPTNTATKAAEPTLTDEQRDLNVKSFDEVWTTVRDKHFDPKLNGVDWDAARAELRPKVESAKTMSESRAAMSELLHRLGQTHFAIIPKTVYHRVEEAGGKTDSKNEEGGSGGSGMDVRIVDGLALITRVEPDSGAAKAGVKAGWQLVSVRGKPVAPIITE